MLPDLYVSYEFNCIVCILSYEEFNRSKNCIYLF